MKVGWVRFFALLLPDVRDLIKELYGWYKGDVDKARSALIHIRNHGLRLDIAEAEIDERMNRARAAEPPKESA